MGSIKRMGAAALSFCVISVFTLQADEPICHHCEEIREYNAAHHENYEYYDQYLKANPAQNSSFKGSPVAERNVNAKIDNKKIVPINSGTTSTDSSGVKTIPSPTTGVPQTGVSAPEAPPSYQAPQRA